MLISKRIDSFTEEHGGKIMLKNESFRRIFRISLAIVLIVLISYIGEYIVNIPKKFESIDKAREYLAEKYENKVIDVVEIDNFTFLAVDVNFGKEENTTERIYQEKGHYYLYRNKGSDSKIDMPFLSCGSTLMVDKIDNHYIVSVSVHAGGICETVSVSDNDGSDFKILHHILNYDEYLRVYEVMPDIYTITINNEEIEVFRRH